MFPHRDGASSRRLLATKSDEPEAHTGKEATPHEDGKEKETQEEKKQEDPEPKSDQGGNEKKPEEENEGGGGGGGGAEENLRRKRAYKQDVNYLQKIIAVLFPVAALAIGIKFLLDTRKANLEDDTMQIDMQVVLFHIYSTTAHNIFNSRKLVKLLGEQFAADPARVKVSFSKDFAWITYPLFNADGKVCNVTIDLLRIDPTKETVKLKKPHMWYVAQIEVDLNDGKKVHISTKLKDLKQPFNIIELGHKLYVDLLRQEEEYTRQQAAAKLGGT